MSTKQRFIDAGDLLVPAYRDAPDEAKPTAVWLWLNLDPFGGGPLDPAWIASGAYRGQDFEQAIEKVTDHLLMLLESGFVTSWPDDDGREWLQLLHPLRCDLRGAQRLAPEPPPESARPISMDVHGLGGRGRVGGSEWAREQARARVRAEQEEAAGRWEQVARERARARGVVRPERPLVLDAPPRYCEKHMPFGSFGKKCGPCGDRRVENDKWLKSKTYETELADFYEATADPDQEPF